MKEYLGSFDGPRKDQRGWFARVGHELRERDGDLCQLCLDPIDFTIKSSHRLKPTVDHIVPLTKGGENSMENFWLAHLHCNARKGNLFTGRFDGSTDTRR